MANQKKSKVPKLKRHHGYAALLFILGTLFPPLAVAARFGIGGDFWLNLLLTICGYIPGHGHNFYIQNIRNNKTHKRTPKWAQRYGLVDTTKLERNKKRSEWAGRYNDRLPNSTLDDQPLEEGQERGPVSDSASEVNGSGQRRDQNGGLWRPEDESYYNEDSNSVATSGSGRWHYPANFDDAVPESTSGTKKTKKKKEKKDRWERTEDAYANSAESAPKKKSKKKRSSSTAEPTDSYNNFPEEAEGGLYGNSHSRSQGAAPVTDQGRGGDTEFDHQF